MAEKIAINDAISVMPQVSQADVQALANDGFTMLVNNRVDGEEPGMPSSADVAAWARDAGLSYHHVPVSMGQLTIDRVQQMRDLLENADGPVLAFCRSGTRSTTIWALSQALDPDANPESLVAEAGAAGFDISPLSNVLQQLNRQARQEAGDASA